MAHNIEIREGVASFVENGAKELAWHSLGQHYDRPLSAVEALEGCHANFEVQKQPIVALTPEIMALLNSHSQVPAELLQNHIISSKMATMRMDKLETLGIVSDEYGIVQNKHAFDFVDVLTSGELGGDTPTIECAGVLGKGERIFITAKFKESIKASSDESKIDLYVVFTTSHDGSGAVSCMITPVRVVCQNTLNFALRNNSGRVNFRHTSGVMNRLGVDVTKTDKETVKRNIAHAMKVMDLYGTYKSTMEDALESYAHKVLDEKQANRILVETLLPSDCLKIFDERHGDIMNSDDVSTRAKNILLAAQTALHDGVGQKDIKSGTGLWLINGLTTYFQNTKSFSNNELKFKSIMEGDSYNKLQKASNLVAQIA